MQVATPPPPAADKLGDQSDVVGARPEAGARKAPGPSPAGGGFLRHAAVYGLGVILIQAAGFLLLPLYTRHLAPSEYGALELVTRVGEVVLVCLLLNGLRQATLAFYNQTDDQARRRAVVATAVLLTCGSAALSGSLLVGASWAVSHGRAGSLELPAGLLLLAGLSIFCDALPVIPLTLMQARVESSRYLCWSLALFLLRTGLCITFVVALHQGAAGVLLASVLASGLIGTVLTVVEVRQLKLQTGSADRSPPSQGEGVQGAARQAGLSKVASVGTTVREMLWFSLPFLPGGVGMFVLNSGDRFFLWAWSGDEAVGLYALGYKLAWAVELLTRAPLHMVWSGKMYQAARDSRTAPAVFGAVFRRIVGVHLWVGLAVSLLADELIAFVAGGRYAGAAVIVPVVVLASVCSTAAALFDAGFYVRRRTTLKVPVTLGAAAVILVLYSALIPAYGAYGAALATLGGFAALAAFTFAGSQRVFPVQYDVPRLAGMFLLAGAVWLAARPLPAELWAVPVKAALAGLFPVLLWATGCVTAEERGLVLAAVRGVRGRFAPVVLRALGVRPALTAEGQA